MMTVDPLWLLSLLYAIPLLGLFPVLLKLGSSGEPIPTNGILLRLGKAEYLLGAPRDFCVMISGAIYVFIKPLLGGVLLLLASVGIYRRRRSNRVVIDYIAMHPDIHPTDFMCLIRLSRCLWPAASYGTSRLVPADELDFRAVEGALPNGLHALTKCIVDTGCIASLAVQTFQQLPGPDALRVFDTLARLWSARCATHLRLKLEISGRENLRKVKNKAVVVLNHESIIDFALGFYAISGTETERGNRLSPRFLAAKDHFKDNPLLHSVLGIGRAMDKAGMIFVERRKKGGGQRVIDSAVESLRTTDVDVAVFPQGTRANVHRNNRGEPIGAGYYTTTKAPVAGPGHFKTGAARIAAGLSAHQSVDIVPVAIVGAAQVMPARHFFEVRPGKTISYRIVEPLTLERGSDTDPSELSRQIDLLLRRTALVHERLAARWQQACGKTDEEAQALMNALEEWRECEDPIPFAVLDSLLSRPQNLRAQYFDEYEQLVVGRADVETWRKFRERIGRV